MSLLVSSLLTLVGRSPSAADVDGWLSSQRIRHRPFLAKEDPEYHKDRYKAEKRAQASEIDEVERHSIALIYAPMSEYVALYGAVGEGPDGQPDRGTFVLRELVFFGPGVQDYEGFAEALPFGLRFGMSGAESVDLMGLPLARRKVHELRSDLWFHEGWIVNASYMEADDGLGILHVRRPHLFDRRMLKLETPPVQRPAFAPLKACLGGTASGAQLRAGLGPIGFDAFAFEFDDEGEVLDFQDSHGLTLYFGGHGKSPDTLTGLRFKRRGDVHSKGWGGDLPHGIEFHQTPRELPEIVGRPPDDVNLAADTGAFVWKFSTYTLHVMFSLIDFQVYRVSVFLPE